MLAEVGARPSSQGRKKQDRIVLTFDAQGHYQTNIASFYAGIRRVYPELARR
ncbi:hypothetical protein FJY63_07115 [Candidatus Sumerlaeota bacterium]|nr:hypothetical protein [Candidatus Sumerlaeota bacterium]